MGNGSVFRVTVRGRFRDLSASARATLERELAHHDIFVSAYTAEGTFTYDEKILFFNLRYEVRDVDDESAACDVGRREAENFLRVLGYDHTLLKVTATNTSEIWDDRITHE